MKFRDALYGAIELPDWLAPFIRLPELLRLRGVRLSNVDSLDFKDFGSPKRWEHAIGVAYLSIWCARSRGLNEDRLCELVLAALLHDVATPPFAHTVEYVLPGFDHERESMNILGGRYSDDSVPGVALYESRLPQFRREVEKLNRKWGLSVDADEVARMVVGDGELGYLICGSLDLDNADNVVRACSFLGMDVDEDLPIELAKWLGEESYIPAEVTAINVECVNKWRRYRRELYEFFDRPTDEEQGREAFLQYLIRRSYDSGLPRKVILWNTDDGILEAIRRLGQEATRDDGGRAGLEELVQEYRLMRPTTKLAECFIDDPRGLQVLQNPIARNYIERQMERLLREPAFVSVTRARRATRNVQTSLFGSEVGSVRLFGLEKSNKERLLADRLGGRSNIDRRARHGDPQEALAGEFVSRVQEWVTDRPWLQGESGRSEAVVESLRAVGDWSFPLSKNESLHQYPATYVHAIPATFIECLGLRGETVFDPFGGTGQTAAEAIKLGCDVVSGDSNSVATMVAQARFSYLNRDRREWLKGLTKDDVMEGKRQSCEWFPGIRQWHHPDTIVELGKIRDFVTSGRPGTARLFLKVCLSGILHKTTARYDKQHGYFADNSPLGSEMDEPPYRDAGRLFIGQVRRNLDIIEKFYAEIDRSGRNVERELERVRVCQVDCRGANAGDYGLECDRVGGIITSPPYLCMSDYALGQRLPYNWLFRDSLDQDFDVEFGSRRERFRPNEAVERYFDGLGQYLETAGGVLRKGGFLATVLGEPEAEAFKELDVLGRYDELARSVGFERIWSRMRPVRFHRRRYHTLNRERLSVHVWRG